jgi:hypothetical protein
VRLLVFTGGTVIQHLLCLQDSRELDVEARAALDDDVFEGVLRFQVCAYFFCHFLSVRFLFPSCFLSVPSLSSLLVFKFSMNVSVRRRVLQFEMCNALWHTLEKKRK